MDQACPDTDVVEVDFNEIAALADQALTALGIDVDNEDELLWAAAVGATCEFWRNTVVEDWHAGPDSRISDGEMMRTNAATARVVRDRLSTDNTAWYEIAAELTDADRVLPNHQTLRDLAPNGEQLDQLRAHATTKAETYSAIQDAQGLRAALAILATLTGFSGSRWYGMPKWPLVVETFCLAVDDPHHTHWRDFLAQPTLQRHRPEDVADTGDLRELLMAGPDHLSAEAAKWCVDARIGDIH